MVRVIHIDKAMRSFSVINNATNLNSYYRDTCPLSVVYEAGIMDKIKFQISLPDVYPFTSNPPRLTGHHIPSSGAALLI
jgi:hypothetical protein